MNKKLMKGYKAVKLSFVSTLVVSLFYSALAFAKKGDDDSGFSGIAVQMMSQFTALGQLVLAVAFLAGLGFIMAAIFKFKQHKDNPQQIPLGTPVAMLVIGAVLVFLPSLIAPAGTSLFGTGKTAGGFTGSGAESIPGGS